jgi:hypothetical protein
MPANQHRMLQLFMIEKARSGGRELLIRGWQTISSPENVQALISSMRTFYKPAMPHAKALQSRPTLRLRLTLRPVSVKLKELIK